MSALYYLDEEVALVEDEPPVVVGQEGPPPTLYREHREARWPAPEGYVWCRWLSNGKHWLHWREQLTNLVDKSGVQSRVDEP